jgi:hypothetical protein
LKPLRATLAALLSASIVFVAAPAASADECTPDDPTPSCQPCGDRINAITQKLYGHDLITCPW